MKSGWAIKKLGEVCEASNGLWKGKKGPFRKIAVLRSTNFTKECQLDLSDVVYIDVESRLLPRKLLREGDIIIEKSGGGPRQPVGRPVYFDKNVGEYSFCNFTSMLRVADSDVLPLYLHRCLYYLYVSGATESLQSYTIGLRNLDFKGYLDLDIPIPPLPEQKRIVVKIDAAFEKIDKLKANAERNLANAKELFQSALDEAMRPKDGWVEKRLGEVGPVCMCKRILKSETNESGGVPFYKIGTFGKTPNAYISEETYRRYRELYKFPRKGEILISAAGTIGRTVVYDGEPAYFQDSNIVWIANDETKVSNAYLQWYYKTSPWCVTKGATIPRLYNDNITSAAIAIPPIAEQRQIVKRLDFLAEKVKLLEQHYTRQIADCAEMRQAVLREAFEGRL